ncbi:unnamed protein product [Lasius platythorax]|uniref:Uncharacterized protein n=1 Tax=Lasius platythorax TaxID=488582 RepID=A0AAV2N2S8_9HYME
MLVASKGLANGRYMTSYRLDFTKSQRHLQAHEPVYDSSRGEPPARSHGRSFRMPLGEQCARVCIQLTGALLSTLHVLCNCIVFCYVVWASSMFFFTVYVAQTCLSIRSAC